MTEGTITTLVDAGPLTIMAISFLTVSAVTLVLAIILYRMLRAFIASQLENIKQTQLTREAIEKLDRNHTVEIQKLAITMEAISLSLARHNMTDKRELTILKQGISKIVKTLDGFVPSVVEILNEKIETNWKRDCDEKAV